MLCIHLWFVSPHTLTDILIRINGSFTVMLLHPWMTTIRRTLTDLRRNAVRCSPVRRVRIRRGQVRRSPVRAGLRSDFSVGISSDVLERRLLLSADLKYGFPVSGIPVAQAAGRFSKDDWLDVVSLSADGQLTLATNQNGQRWSSVSTISLGLPDGIGVASASVSKDDLADLIIVSSDRITIAVSDGAQGFRAVQTLTPALPGQFARFSRSSVSMATGLFDQDFLTDLAIVVPGSGELLIFRGLQNGQFSEPSRYVSGGQEPVGVVSGQFSGGPEPDLAVAHSDGRIAIFTGDGNGTFHQDSVQFPVELQQADNGEVQTISAADLSSDGETDLIVSLSDGVVILINEPDPVVSSPIVNGRFEQGLTGWTTQIVGHSGNQVAGTVTSGGDFAVLTENQSFLTSLQQTFVVPSLPQTISFDIPQLNLQDPGGLIPDAFEVSLLDNSDRSLVPVHRSTATSFLNRASSGSVSLAAGVAWDGITVTLDISHLVPGTEARLIFDLVGHPQAGSSSVIVDNVLMVPDRIVSSGFTARRLPGILQQVSGSTVGDFNGDGLPDIAVADISTGSVFIYSGEVGEEPPSDHWTRTEISLATWGTTPSSLISARLSRDRFDDDLIVAMADSRTVISSLGSVDMSLAADLIFPAAGSTVRTLIREILVEFSKDVQDGGSTGKNSVTSTNAWQLAEAGPDGVLRTSDDVPIRLSSIDWNAALRRATLNVADGNLNDGYYLLTVEGENAESAVIDLEGNRLNGGLSQSFHLNVNASPAEFDPVELISVVEVQPAVLKASFRDQGSSDSYTAVVDWGDGNVIAGSVTFLSGFGMVVAEHLYVDEGQYRASIRLTDGDGRMTSQSFSVVIHSVVRPPTISGADFATEGGRYQLSLDGGYPGISQWLIDWGDGTPQQLVAADQTVVAHVFADGPVTRRISVTAARPGSYALLTKEVNVQNVSQQLTISGLPGAFIGQPYWLNLAAADPGDDRVTHWRINWGDGTEPELIQGNPASVVHFYTGIPATYRIQAEAWDEDLALGSGSRGYFSNQLFVTCTFPENRWLPKIDFETDANGEPLVHGQVVTDQFRDWGITVSTTSSSNPAVILRDGRGLKGLSCINDGVLVIGDRPGGKNSGSSARGGVMVFRFDDPVKLDQVALREIATPGGYIELFDETGRSISVAAIPKSRRWEEQTIALDGSNVRRMEIHLTGSAAVTDIVFCRQNYPTSVQIAGDFKTHEGHHYLLSLNAGSHNPIAWEVDWGDGTPVEYIPGHVTEIVHVYTDNQRAAITAIASSSTSRWFANPLSIDVKNVSPVIGLSGSDQIEMNAHYRLTLSATDPGTDTIVGWRIDWGDGTWSTVKSRRTPENSETVDDETADDEATIAEISVSHVYRKTGEMRIRVFAVDEDGVHQGPDKRVNVVRQNVMATRFFVVDAHSDRTWRYDSDGNSLGSFSLKPSNNVRGVTTNGSGMPIWTIDSNHTVYVYDPAEEKLLGAWHAEGLKTPEDIAVDGDDLLIVDRGLDRVLIFQGAARLLSGRHRSNRSFPLHRDNSDAQGIATNGVVAWVVDKNAKAVVVYRIADGALVGRWQIDGRNSHPSGITIDPRGGHDIWISDRNDNRVYRYSEGTARRKGRQSAANWFPLAKGNRHPEGIADPTYPYSLNDVISDNIETVGEINDYQFSATVGQKIFVDVQLVQSGFLHVSLLDPDGATVIGYGFDASPRNPDEADGSITITKNGMWTLRAESRTRQTPSYQIVVYDVPPPVQRVALPEVSYSGQISVPGALDEWLIDIAAGQILTWDFGGITGGAVRTELFSPTGERIFGTLAVDSGPIVFQQSGRYRLVVDGIRDDIPAYQFIIRDSSPVIRQTAIDQAQTSTIEGLERPDIWEFHGQVGDTIYLDLQAISGGIEYELFGPNNVSYGETRNFILSALDRGPMLLDQTGIWKIHFRSPSATLPKYTFRIWNVPDPDVYESPFGELMLGNIESPGRQDIFQFRGYAGQQIYIDFQQNNTWVEWQFRRPDDSTMATASAFLISQLDSSPITLPVDGLYSLITNARLDSLGEFQFRIFDITPAAPTQIELDQIVTGSLNQPGRQIKWTVDALAGERLKLDVLYNESGLMAWTISTPSGQTLFQNAAADQETGLLSESGRYTITVDQSPAVHTDATGQFSFRMIRPDQSPPLPVPSDLVVSTVIRPSVVVGKNISLEVTWTVTNFGPGITGDHWFDRIYLSADRQFQRAQERLTAEVMHHGSLQPGESYTRVQTIVVPAGFEGDLSVIVETDAWNNEFELLAEDNNARVSAPTAVYHRLLESGPPAVEAHLIDGQQFPAGSRVALSGTATVLPSTANLVFAIDLSNSTLGSAGSDANFDGIADQQDDLNGDGSVGDILDVEIGSLLRIVQSLRDNRIDARVAIVPFATFTDYMDLSPLPFFQTFVSPDADQNRNGIFDIDESVVSLTSGSARKFRELSLGIGTNFSATTILVDEVLERALPAEKSQVFFLTDGDAPVPDDADLQRLAAKGIDFYGFQISGTEVTRSLRKMGETIDADPRSAGRTFLVSDPQDLGAALLQSLQVIGVTVNNQGVQSLDAAGNFFTPVSVHEGQQTIQIRAIDSWGRSTLRQISLFGVSPSQPSASVSQMTAAEHSTAVWSGPTFNRNTAVLHADLKIRNVSGEVFEGPILASVDELPVGLVQLQSAEGYFEPDRIPWVHFDDELPDGRLLPGQQSEVIPMQFSNPALLRFAAEISLLHSRNQSPWFTSVPTMEVRSGTPFRSALEAMDAEGQELVFQLIRGPVGMQLQNHTGAAELIWEPTELDIGNHDIEVQAADGHGGFAVQRWQLTVSKAGNNRPPVFRSIPDVSAIPGMLWVYDADAADVDGDALTYSLDFGPPSASVDPISGLVTISGVHQGVWEIGLRVSDGQGGQAVQQFSVSAGILPQNPHAPTILSTPAVNASSGQPWLYLPLALDSDGDVLTWSLLTAPVGLQIEQATGRLDWLPPNDLTGQFDVILQVTDGLGGFASQFFTLTTGGLPLDQAPYFASLPVTAATTGTEYRYEPLARDPEGSLIRYELVSGPAGMQLLNDGDSVIGLPTPVLRWISDSPAGRNFTVQLKAVDISGQSALQTYLLQVRGPNVAPVITSVPVTIVTADSVYRYDVDATDAEDSVRYELINRLPGMHFNSITGLILWNPTDAEIGSYPLEVRAVDDRGAVTTQRFVLDVIADIQPPEVAVLLSNQIIQPGDLISLSVIARDNVSVTETTLQVNGVIVPLDDRGSAVYRPTAPGLYEVVAVAADARRNSATSRRVLRVIDPFDQSAPIITVTSPSPGSVVSWLTDIQGSIIDDHLESWSVAWSPLYENQWTTFAGQTYSDADGIVSNAILATFDPTLLMNDSYEVRITASDLSGNVSTLQFELHLEGHAKIGNYRMEFTDLTVPLAGIPLTIIRTWDTLQAGTSGDFGFGWMMGLIDGRIRETRPVLENESLFHNLGFRTGTRVYINTPDGRRVGFTFDPVAEGGALGTLFRPHFRPDRGVYEQLMVEDVPLRQNPDGSFSLYFGGFSFNPREYTLTTKDQVRYHYDQFDGLISITNRNNVRLTHTADGIFSSFGPSVTWTRDALGRIIKITDPDGHQIVYQYSDAGDLTSVTNQTGNSTTMSYLSQPAHFLSEARDHHGNTEFTATYDDSGRLQALGDAFGNTTSHSVDLLRNTETIVDRVGNPMVLTYDRRGNITAMTNPLGQTTVMVYDASDELVSVTDARGFTTSRSLDDRGNVVERTDADGGIWKYTYNSLNDLLTQTDPLGRSVVYSRDAGGNLTGITDPNGVTTSMTLDPIGRTVMLTDPLGSDYHFEYSDRGSPDPVRVTNPDGTVRSMTFNIFGETTSLTNERGHQAQFRYNAAGHLISAADALGGHTQYAWDGTSLISITGPDGSVVHFEYDAAGRKVKETDPLGGITEYQYDANNQLITMIRPGNSATQYRYTADGRMQSVIDAMGGVTGMEYDATGNLVAAVNSLGHRLLREYDGLGRMTSERWQVHGELRPAKTFEFDAAGNVVRETSESGHSTAFQYDRLNRMTEKKDALGAVEAWQYDTMGNIVVYTDALGRSTHYERDSRSRLISETDAAGYSTVWTYDEVGNVTSMTDKANHLTRFAYDPLNRIVKTIDPMGGTTLTAWDIAGNLYSVTDSRGGTTTFLYDPMHRMIQQTDAMGETTLWEYDLRGNTVRTTDERGSITSFEFDLLDRTIRTVSALGYATTYEWDAAGRQVSVTDARNHTTRYEYDENHRMIRQTNAQGGVQQWVYDAVGNLESWINERGYSTTMAYDPAGRLTEVRDAMGGTTTFVHDAVGKTIEARDPGGNVVRAVRDELGRIVSQTDPLGYSEFFQWNAVSFLTSSTDKEGNVTRYEYDGLNRRTALTDPNGGTTTWQYDSGNNVISVSDPLGRTTHFEYDDLGRRTSFTDALGAATRFAYDAAGNQTAVIDAAGNVSLFEFDQMNQLIRDTNALGDTRTYEWDPVGNLKQSTDRNGRVRQFTYDELNRRTAEFWLQANNVLREFTYTYDSVGNLTRAADGQSDYSISRDPLSRISQIASVAIDGRPGLVLSYEYDAAGNVVRRSDQAGVTVSSVYDARNQLVSSRWSGGETDPIRAEYSWDARGGRMLTRRFQNAGDATPISSTSWQYDSAGRLNSMQHWNAVDELFSDLNIEWNLAGEILSRTLDGNQTSYAFDETGQLTFADHDQQVDEFFEYDAVGNRVNDERIIGTANQLLSDRLYAYRFDAEGNLIRRTEKATGIFTVYEYDYRNRLVSARTFSAGDVLLVSVESVYDVFDRRISRIADTDGSGPLPAGILNMVYDGHHTWADFDESGQVLARYLFGPSVDEITARWTPADGTAWYLSDQAGSVLHLLDSAGNVINTSTYDSFGQIVHQSNVQQADRFGFTGREWDAELGYYYYRARYYDPTAGRFLSEDPDQFAAGDVNLYRYTGNRPLVFTDPSGRTAIVSYASFQDRAVRVANAAAGAALGYVCGYTDGWYTASYTPGADPESAAIAEARYATALGFVLGAALSAVPQQYAMFHSIASVIAVIGAQATLQTSRDVVQLAIRTACFALSLYPGAISPKNRGPLPGQSIFPGSGLPSVRPRLSPEHEDVYWKVNHPQISDPVRNRNLLAPIVFYRPTSGTYIYSTPGKTTTIIGRDWSDILLLKRELNLSPLRGTHEEILQSFKAANPGGFNVLHIDMESVRHRAPTVDDFFELYNVPWLKAAAERGDEIVVISSTMHTVDEFGQVTVFGREVNYLMQVHKYRWNGTFTRLLPPRR